ncbi:hypothetical protein ACFLYZ_02230 [Thermodesulfobacteriota bacterium]
MEPIYIASLASFMVGLFGYIIVRFWILPIGRYLKVKGRLASDIKVLLEMLRAAGPQNNDGTQIQDQRVAVGRHCSDLATIYQNDLPYWYQLYLESKKEQPLEAIQYSMRLVNTREQEHVLRQANEIKQFLRLKD